MIDPPGTRPEASAATLPSPSGATPLQELETLRREVERLRESGQQELGRAKLRTDRLNALGTALARARTVEQVISALVQTSHLHFGADATVAFLLSDDRQLRLAGSLGTRPGVDQRFGVLPLETDLPLPLAIRSGQPVYLEDPSEIEARFPAMAGVRLPAGPVQALMAISLTAGGAPVGGISFSFARPQRFDPDERGLLEAMALQCVPALERAAAYDAEVQARRRAESLSARLQDQQQSLQMLADVGALFSSELAFEQRLRETARLVVPRLADWCAIDVLAEGQVSRLVVHHQDPLKVELAHQMQRRFPPDPNAPRGVAQVLRTGRTELLAEITDQLLVQAIHDSEQLRMTRELGLRSSVVVPIKARGAILGALTLVYAESNRRFGPVEVALAEEVAARAGLALENSLLFREAQASRDNLKNLFDQAPAPIAILRGPEHLFEFANPPYLALVGRERVVGLTVQELFPELASQGFLDILDGVYRTGQTYEGRAVPVRLRWKPELPEEQRYLNIIYQASRSATGAIDGILVFAFDVTDQEEAAGFLRRRNAQLALSAEVGTAFSGSLDLPLMLQRVCAAVVTHLGAAFARVWTISEDQQTLELRASAGLYTHLDGAHARVPVGQFKIGLIAREAQPHLTNDVQHDPRVGNPEWARREGMVSFAGYPLMVEGRVVGVLALFGRSPMRADVLQTLAAISDAVAVGIERKRNEQRLAEERETLDVLNLVGRRLAAELDLDALVQAVTDSATRLCGARWGAFFYNLVDDRGDGYTLTASCGAPREAFATFPRPGGSSPLTSALENLGLIRLEDVRSDPRFTAAGALPVASYLSVPVSSRTGQVLGGLVFGHPSPGTFTERAEKLVAGIAAQAAVAMDNARLFKDAQRLISALERSNAELDQFAYVASHDLKAPLRGIANLSQWIEEDLAGVLSGETRKQMDLLRGRVARMEALIEGILSYSRAGRTRSPDERVDVRKLLTDTVELIAPRPPASVVVEGSFPELFTERVPLQQVFMNLIANALKHSGRPDARITVRAEETATHYQFQVQDNGPGIAPEFHERIWGIFQTLEARDKVESTGIGLAIVKKLVESRGGQVGVRSAPGGGATFFFSWPRSQERAG